ncbi:MAG: hypothetical protein AAF617_14275 [Bacteroidota bacterium]
MKYKLLLFVIISSLSGCIEMQQPKENEVLPGPDLPIDGVWDMIVINQDGNRIDSESRFKFSKSRLIVEEIQGFGDKYLLDKGQVFAKDIVKTGKDSYKGVFFITTSESKLCECEIFIEVKNNTLICKTTGKKCDKAVMYTDLIFENPVFENPDLFSSTHNDTKLSGFKISPLTEIKVRASSEIQKVSKGSKIEIERNRMIQYQINISTDNSILRSTNYKIGAKLPKAIELEIQKNIKNKLEQVLGKAITLKEEYKVKVSLDGNESERYNLIWYDKLKTGSVEYLDTDKKKKVIYFQFPVSTELEVNKLE